MVFFSLVTLMKNLKMLIRILEYISHFRPLLCSNIQRPVFEEFFDSFFATVSQFHPYNHRLEKSELIVASEIFLQEILYGILATPHRNLTQVLEYLNHEILRVDQKV